MKKHLNKQDIINLLNNKDFNFTITRPSKHNTRIEFTPKKYKCFGCKELTSKDLLEVRLDERVTSLILPRKFCKTCIKQVDDILKRLKTKSTPNWIK